MIIEITTKEFGNIKQKFTHENVTSIICKKHRIEFGFEHGTPLNYWIDDILDMRVLIKGEEK